MDSVVSRVVKANVPGDFVEFGVALGGTSIILAKYANAAHRFHGFDVFAMIPPPNAEKDDEKSIARYKVIKSGKSKGIRGNGEYYGYRDNLIDEVKLNFRKFGLPVDGERIQLHKGLFEETWPKSDIGTVCFAHIDCDWYDSVAYCLKAIKGKMPVGSAILLDDYNDYGGARTAVDEFVAKNQDFEFESGLNPVLWKRR